jgi:toxin ParE1/3/4
MREIRLTAVAEDDLVEIWLYTQVRWGPDQADGYLEELEQGIARLACDAGIGAARETVRAGYRVLFVSSHAIYYKFDAIEVRIIRVLHGRMDPEVHLHSFDTTENGGGRIART